MVSFSAHLLSQYEYYNSSFISLFSFPLQRKELRGRKALARWIAPRLNTSFSLLVTLMTLLPGSIEGLMGLWEEQSLSSFSLKGLELGNESPPFQVVL